jgi:hypothetical protein
VEVTVTSYAPAGVPVTVVVFVLFSLSHPTSVPNAISSTTPKTMTARRRRALGPLPASSSPSSPMPLSPASRIGAAGVAGRNKAAAAAADDDRAFVLMLITVLSGVAPLATTELGLNVHAAAFGRLVHANVIVPV